MEFSDVFSLNLRC